MQILNIAGYQFTPLTHLDDLQKRLHETCLALQIKGTILLSSEGININLSGDEANIHTFKAYLLKQPFFTPFNFHETYSTAVSFKRLKVKIKKEIITLRKSEVDTHLRAPAITPETLKNWLDEKRDITLLDTRNDYEVRFGTFKGALNLQLKGFQAFPEALATVEKNKPVVMFCTGGIRCEKAALYMLNQGYTDVYQLEGGILGYFAKIGGAHYEGECFVFDERVSVDPDLRHTGTSQCVVCQGPVTSQGCRSGCP